MGKMEKWMKNSKMNWKPKKIAWFKDSDRDGVVDIFDCKPHNKRKQGFQHQYSFSSTGSKNIKTVKMPPELFLKTTWGEARRHTSIASKRYHNDSAEEEVGPVDANVGPYNRFKDNLIHGANGIRFKERKWILVDGEPVPGKFQMKETSMRQAIEGNSRQHLPVPFLQFNEEGKQISHEGRHTALVAERMGMKHIPVTIEKPKDVRLTTKYERLPEIKGKQYKDWEYDEEKHTMKEAPIITKEDLEEEDGKVA